MSLIWWIVLVGIGIFLTSFVSTFWRALSGWIEYDSARLGRQILAREHPTIWREFARQADNFEKIGEMDLAKDLRMHAILAGSPVPVPTKFEPPAGSTFEANVERLRVENESLKADLMDAQQEAAEWSEEAKRQDAEITQLLAEPVPENPVERMFSEAFFAQAFPLRGSLPKDEGRIVRPTEYVELTGPLPEARYFEEGEEIPITDPRTYSMIKLCSLHVWNQGRCTTCGRTRDW